MLANNKLDPSLHSTAAIFDYLLTKEAFTPSLSSSSAIFGGVVHGKGVQTDRTKIAHSASVHKPDRQSAAPGRRDASTDPALVPPTALVLLLVMLARAAAGAAAVLAPRPALAALVASDVTSLATTPALARPP